MPVDMEGGWTESGTDEDGKSWSTKARPIATGVEDSDSDDEYFFVADFPAAKNSGSSMLMGRLASDKSAVVWGDGNAWTALNGTARGCDRCVDRGPWPCLEEGCPSNEVDCGTLLHAGACLSDQPVQSADRGRGAFLGSCDRVYASSATLSFRG